MNYHLIVNNIADEIGEYLVKRGRMQVSQTKEKFGTVRVYVTFGWTGLHNIIWPGYMYNQWSKDWMHTLDWKIGYPLTSLLNRVVIPWHIWLYKRAYKKAMRKYPGYRQAILEGADWAEFLEEL